MPLIKSKSKHAFEKNIGAEMDAGKPQKQALAIAYAVKRKSAHKKMAKGGMVIPEADKAREHDPVGIHEEAGDFNEDLNPMHEASHGVEDEVLGEYDLSHKEQDYGQLPHPAEPMKHYDAADEDKPGFMRGHDGMVDHIMHKRKMRMMAQGGEIPANEEDILKENRSYPDPDFKELDMLDPDEMEMMADGGTVPTPSPSSDFADKMKKAWNPDKLGTVGEPPKKAHGGEIEDAEKMKKKKRMHAVFSSMHDDE